MQFIFEVDPSIYQSSAKEIKFSLSNVNWGAHEGHATYILLSRDKFIVQ